MATVMTATGPIASDQLGFTLTHEHVFADFSTGPYQWSNTLYQPEVVYEELMRFKNAGGSTVVDMTSGGIREIDPAVFPWKQPEAVKEMAERTGLTIVLGTGWFREPFYDPYVYQARTDQIADDIVRDLTEGIDGTDVRAGVIGEIGAEHSTWILPQEERVLRAAARAQKQTGVSLATHASAGPVGLYQLDLLEEEGVDLNRVIIGHAHMNPDHEYHAEIARRGAYVSFDTLGRPQVPYIADRELGLVRQMVDNGLIGHLLFSHDVSDNSHYNAAGSGGFDFISTKWLETLREIGVTDEQFQQVMVDNSRRALTGED